MTEFKKGQRAYMMPLRMERRRNARTKEVIVETIGPKYITVSCGAHKFKFDKETRMEVNGYSAQYRLFQTIEAAQEEQQRDDLEVELRNRFNNEVGGLTLDQLQRIAAILEEED